MADTDPFSGTPTAHYFARYGTALLAPGSHTTNTDRLHAELVEAIKADSRVVNVDRGAMNSNWTTTSQAYPVYGKASNAELLSGSDHFHIVRYSDSIMFEIRVPSKNQPEIYGEAPDPETYLAAWDGVTVVVLWSRDAAENYAPGPAGQVVLDIIRVAVERTKSRLYVQPCSQGCELKFGHRALAITHWSGAEYLFESSDGPHNSVSTRIAGTLKGLALVEAVHDELKMAGSEFAATKNIARRIIQIERAAREMTFELIQLDYFALQLSQRSPLARFANWFAGLGKAAAGKSSSQRAKFLIAALWLAMASIETLQQAHAESRRDFEDSVSKDRAVGSLFAFDLKSDELVVESIDASFARAAIDHKTSRMDSKSVVAATLVGALVGGILALIGGWLATAGGLVTLG